MQLEHKLDESISRWNLLESRFYLAWSEGCLPRESLARYANEYGAFICLIPQGWASHGDAVMAAEEREHVELWREFAETLGVDIGEAETPAVRELVETAGSLFADATTSLGALYAFEAQQPRTAATKLAGLREHYDLSAKAHSYFAVHADDEEEPALLQRRMLALSPSEQVRAAEACEKMCRALRKALDELAPADLTVH